MCRFRLDALQQTADRAAIEDDMLFADDGEALVRYVEYWLMGAASFLPWLSASDPSFAYAILF